MDLAYEDYLEAFKASPPSASLSCTGVINGAQKSSLTHGVSLKHVCRIGLYKECIPDGYHHLDVRGSQEDRKGLNSWL